jgi:hypothetical protein
MTSEKRRCGFAVIDRATVIERACKGGKSAHAKGVAHQFTSEEAKAAGRLGGNKAAENRRALEARLEAYEEAKRS